MLVGRVGGPFGVRGEIKVELHTDFPERFERLAHGYFGPNYRRQSIEGSRTHKGQVLLKLKGLDTREAVEELRGEEIFVPRDEAVPLPEGHYYLDDLLDMTVATTSGHPIGRVTDVLRTGSNEVLVVNEGRDAVLIPVIKDAVRVLDLEGRQVVVEDWVLRVED